MGVMVASGVRRGKVHTILIVDDEPRILDSVRMNLELEGYQVFEVTNGQEALDAVRLRLPDLVVMDVMMPQMDGFEALRELRKFSAVPVVLLTVKADERDVIHGSNLEQTTTSPSRSAQACCCRESRLYCAGRRRRRRRPLRGR